MQTPHAVYILASQRNGTLYVGCTSDLEARTWLHKEKAVDGFTKKYGVTKLVYYEVHDDMLSAFKREKLLKKWKREWKIKLIEKSNPEWKDLTEEH